MSKNYEYLTVEEFLEAFRCLSKEQNMKLILANRVICSTYRLQQEQGSLINEVFFRITSGSRHIPKNEDFVKAFTFILKSVAQGVADKKSGNEIAMSQLSDSEVYRCDEILQTPSVESYFISCEDISEEEGQRSKVLSFFANDKEIIDLVSAKLDGMKSKDIVNAIFKGNKTAYDTVYRRFKRGIPKLLLSEADRYE